MLKKVVSALGLAGPGIADPDPRKFCGSERIWIQNPDVVDTESFIPDTTLHFFKIRIRPNKKRTYTKLRSNTKISIGCRKNLCGHHLLDIFGEHVDCKLVGCHHDGRVGYLSYQLCSQAPANKKEFNINMFIGM
jgi:hypothetical protein